MIHLHPLPPFPPAQYHFVSHSVTKHSCVLWGLRTHRWPCWLAAARNLTWLGICCCNFQEIKNWAVCRRVFQSAVWNFNFWSEVECLQRVNIWRLLKTMSLKRNCFLQKFYYEELPVAVLGVFAGELTAFTDTVAMHWLSPVPCAGRSLHLDRVIYCKRIQVVPGSQPALSSKNKERWLSFLY